MACRVLLFCCCWCVSSRGVLWWQLPSATSANRRLALGRQIHRSAAIRAQHPRGRRAQGLLAVRRRLYHAGGAQCSLTASGSCVNSGNLAATGLWVSYSAIQFGTYRELTTLCPEHLRRDHNTIVSTANGALAGVLATAVTYPLDLCRTVFASQGVPKRFPTMQSFVVHTWRTRGVVGFYSGLSPTLLQIAPYMGLSFGIYSSLNALVAEKRELPISGLSYALSLIGTGAVAGLLSKLVVYPMDTVKKRMQLRSVPRCASYGVIPHYETSWACAVDILQREGVLGLYKGTLPSLAKSVVTHSTTFATYEAALVLLQHIEHW